MTRGSTAAGFDESEKPRRDRDASRPLGGDDLLGVLDRLTDGILIVDLDGRIEYVNEPAGNMLSRPNSELLGKRVWDEFPGSIGHPFQLAAGDAVRSGSPQRLVERYEPLDRWFEARLFPHENRVVILFRDVTDELRAEDELREYVSRISEAERIVRFGIWKWEVKSGRVRWSDELYRIYGIEHGTFGGTVDAFIERVHPDDRERVWGNIAQSLETLEPFVFEERIIRSDGAPRVLLSQGRVIAGPDGSAQALVGVCHDVTDRARVERALGASERRMRAIIDNTPSLISVKDLDGRYLMSNAEYERVIGIASGELVGMRCSDVFPSEISEAQRANDRVAVTDGEPVYDEAVLKRDGEPRTFVTVTFALPDEDGVPAEVCTIATDVTERKERESVRRERREWAERIGSGLAEGRMLVFAQPIVSMASGEPAARELLVRMRTRGERSEVLTPAAFLPAAERYGLVQSIDVWMVRQALELTREIVTER